MYHNFAFRATYAEANRLNPLQSTFLLLPQGNIVSIKAGDGETEREGETERDTERVVETK